MMQRRLIAGCMTGTSLDGIDAALVAVEGEGLDMRAEVVRTASSPLRSLGKLLRPVVLQKRVTAGQVARYSFMLGMSHMMLLRKLLGEDTPDLIAVHGQTIYHEAGVTMQLIHPHPIAADLGAPVVFDLRGADMAAGGEGAPITPLADHILFRDADRTRAVVNLGGFANYTWLPPTRHDGEAALTSIRGGDICSCNQLLDSVARRVFKKRYDKGGQRALVGQVDEEALNFLMMMLEAQAGDGRSLGTGDEATDWVRMFKNSCSGTDLAHTACAAIGRVVASAVGGVDQVILAGGGTHNQALVDQVRQHADGEVLLSDDLGVPTQYREAIAMAVLGALSADRVPITLPQITGCQKTAVGGSWIYP